jgi:hypothetical protein
MTRLALPDVRLRESLVDTMADFAEVTQMHGSGFWHLGQGAWPDTGEQGIAELVDLLRGFADPDRELGEALVHSDYLWITDGEPERVVTCDDDNEPSRRTIERNGGVLEDIRKGRRRYWIVTAGRRHSGR